MNKNEYQTALSYLALGDSYTIGEGVLSCKRWPVILAHLLRSEGVNLEDPRIIATTGWTTHELLTALQQSHLEPFYDMVSILIGVNNQYRGQDLSRFGKEFTLLLEKALGLVGGFPQKVFALSIPDYGVTPFGKEKDPERISSEINLFNAVKKAICNDYGVAFFDITTISRRAEHEPELMASDGLHPSGKMYELWVRQIFYDVKAMLMEPKINKKS
jgi:lysophospholipase L1-like esterase